MASFLLKKGDAILNETAQHFIDIHHVFNLAAPLLEGVFKEGGYGYVKSQFSPGAVPSPILIAQSVLEEWCTHRPEEATGAKLHGVLRNVLLCAALEFKKRVMRFAEDDQTKPASEAAVNVRRFLLVML